MGVHEFIIASGIFNLKKTISNEDWTRYIVETLCALNDKSTLGFAFNILTKYSDADKMREDLYYADPCYFFDLCKTQFSRKVALIHDYEEYDFTIVVRK